MSRSGQISVYRAPVMTFDATNRIVSMDIGDAKVSFAIENFWSFSETIAEYALMTSLVVPPKDGASAHGK